MSTIISELFQIQSLQVVLGNFLDIESIIVSKDVFNFLDLLALFWKIVIIMILI